MAEQKYDWIAYKEDFLASPYFNVTQWAREFKGELPAIKNKNFIQATKGWKKEKDAMKTKINEITLQQVIKKVASKNAEAYGNVAEALFALSKAVKPDVEGAIKVGPKDLRQIWHMIRVENNMVTNIGQNEVFQSEGRSPDAVRNALLAKIKDVKARSTSNRKKTTNKGGAR